MINDDILQAMKNALVFRASKFDTTTHDHKIYNNDKALQFVEALISGDTIASLWSVEDIFSINGDCDIEQISKDGEDDGLTWYHCNPHDNDTLDTQYCEDHPPIVTLEQARATLKLAERNHDAEYGINWDSLRDALDQVRGE